MSEDTDDTDHEKWNFNGDYWYRWDQTFLCIYPHGDTEFVVVERQHHRDRKLIPRWESEPIPTLDAAKAMYILLSKTADLA
jgi:hypothetical protein